MMIKMKFLFIGTTLLLGCAVQQPGLTDAPAGMSTPILDANATGTAAIITNQALKSYREEYLDAGLHKVFAQSDMGAWSWKSNRTSSQYAIANALAACQTNNKKHEGKFPCKIINIDGQWTGDTKGSLD